MRASPAFADSIRDVLRRDSGNDGDCSATCGDGTVVGAEAETGGGAQPSSILHFGLGQHSGPVRLNVTWPDGHAQVRSGVSPRTLVTIAEE